MQSVIVVFGHICYAYWLSPCGCILFILGLCGGGHSRRGRGEEKVLDEGGKQTGVGKKRGQRG